jgi:septin family protein
MDLSIHNIPTSKDDIDQPPLARDENMYIAPLGASILICGKSGSGKSTLLANLLMDDRFYKGYFVKTFLFSPTANGDDVQKALNIPKKHVCTDLGQAPSWLETILKCQSKKLEGGGKAAKVDQYCIIFDDEHQGVHKVLLPGPACECNDIHLHATL